MGGLGDLSLGSKLRFFDFTKPIDLVPMRWTSFMHWLYELRVVPNFSRVSQQIEEM
ncbi:hypothetical protein SAMN04490197_4135 [Pseudomonas orientalis]|uniref:Uncharacterized protein n=1 Tax=Pseudomonas orientalis TaxID=76758 RepID=A0A8B3Y1I5_9PSED|nr:hypothetical protein SAMN04490197_4135 [Pseudomonas orientalis]